MKQFKVVMIYLVKATDRQEAIKFFGEAAQVHEEKKYFEVQVVKEVENTGWIAGIGKQLFGK